MSAHAGGHEYNRRLTDGRDGRDNLAKLQLVQDGGFTSGIKTDLHIHSVPSNAFEVASGRTINIPGLLGAGRGLISYTSRWHRWAIRTHLLLAEETREEPGDGETHGCCRRRRE